MHLPFSLLFLSLYRKSGPDRVRTIKCSKTLSEIGIPTGTAPPLVPDNCDSLYIIVSELQLLLMKYSWAHEIYHFG
ncbi:hypothetical protein LguiA_027052 [Lonicera macranthoides]